MVFIGILYLLRRGWEPFDFAIYCKIETLSAFLIFLLWCVADGILGEGNVSKCLKERPLHKPQLMISFSSSSKAGFIFGFALFQLDSIEKGWRGRRAWWCRRHTLPDLCVWGERHHKVDSQQLPSIGYLSITYQTKYIVKESKIQCAKGHFILSRNGSNTFQPTDMLWIQN